VPLTIGLALLTAVLQTRWHRTDRPEYLRPTRFFGTLLVINVALGVVTGLVQEFPFGMNWSGYSRFVGDVFGAPLAMMYPRMMVSSSAAANDLTVAGSASSPYALRVMTVVLAVLLPVVLAYQGWTYHVFRNRVSGRVDHGPQPLAAAGPTVAPDDRAPRRVVQAPAAGSSAPLARFVSWLLAWLAAFLIVGRSW
jgi:cytochrome bd-type quinol oxidase subunit 2